LILLEIVFSVLIAHVKCISLARIYPLIPFPGHYIFVFENEAVSISSAKIKMQKNCLKLAAFKIIVVKKNQMMIDWLGTAALSLIITILVVTMRKEFTKR